MTILPRDLRQVNVLAEATDIDLEEIAQNSIYRSVEEDAFFFFQGDPAEYLYILTSGQVKLLQTNPSGKQVNIRTIQPWEMFAALGAIRKDATYPVSAQALQDSTALAIKSIFMNEMMRTRPYLAMALSSLMATLVQEIQVRYRELATERVEQRIARTLLRLAVQLGKRVERETTMVELSFSRQDLAEMAGTTLFTVSRTLSDWEKLGFIQAGRERITIKNPHELVKIAEQTD